MFSDLIIDSCDWYPEVKAFRQWFETAKPLDKYVYFKGVSISVSFKGEQLAKVVYKYSKEGKVYLTRKRTGVECFDFIVIKASEVPPKRLIPQY